MRETDRKIHHYYTVCQIQTTVKCFYCSESLTWIFFLWLISLNVNTMKTKSTNTLWRIVLDKDKTYLRTEWVVVAQWLYCVHLWSSGTELLSWWRRSSDSDQTCRPTAPPPRPSRPSQNPEDSETRHMNDSLRKTRALHVKISDQISLFPVTSFLPSFLSYSRRAVCSRPLLTGCSASSSHSAWDFQICLTFVSSEDSHTVNVLTFIYKTFISTLMIIKIFYTTFSRRLTN